METTREPPRDRPEDGERAGDADAGVRCPYCRGDLPDDALVGACAACGTLHHLQCFGDHGGCSTHGCGSTRARARKLGEKAAPAEFAPLTCHTCRQALPLDAVVARCSGCNTTLHLGCYEHTQGCSMAVAGACRGTVELMPHRAAAAAQIRRHGRIMGTIGAAWATLAALLTIPGLVGAPDAPMPALMAVVALLGLVTAWLGFGPAFRRARRLEADAPAPQPPRARPPAKS